MSLPAEWNVESPMRRNRVNDRVPIQELCGILFSQDERRAIEQLYASGGLRERRMAVDYLWAGEGVRQNRKFIFQMCDRMIPDRSTHVRWQSLLILGYYAESHPAELWPIVAKWGCDRRDDVRMGVSVCVLENILEHHFDPYFEKSLELINLGNRRFASTLRSCWISHSAIPPRLRKRFEKYKEKGIGPTAFT